MSSSVEIVEVGPRDGLQNEDVILSTDQKLHLLEHLVASGLRRIEAVSFAHPRHVPQMADAEAVMAGVDRGAGVSYIGLVMNDRGWQRALDAGVDEVNVPIFATDTFTHRNQGTDIDGGLRMLERVIDGARAEGIPITATIGVAWGCPFEGEVDLDRLTSIAGRVSAMGVSELALADTIGVADPWAVENRLGAVQEVTGDIPLRVHFHDTRNTGIANAYAAIDAGVRAIDASVGGVGGCPFAPAATGNIATDDLVYMLDRADITSGVDLSVLIGVSAELEDMLGHEVPAMVPKAGLFPPSPGTEAREAK
jgi:hydroxymethylglutaryl-CoA lyase